MFASLKMKIRVEYSGLANKVSMTEKSALFGSSTLYTDSGQANLFQLLSVHLI